VLAESNLDKVTVDVGKPFLGIFLGLLVIASTMGSFLLWDNHQRGADASPNVVANENSQLTTFPKIALIKQP